MAQFNGPMLLSDYEWSRNPRGMHVESPFDSQLSVRDYRQWGMGWVKLLIASDDYFDLIPRFLDAEHYAGGARIFGPARQPPDDQRASAVLPADGAGGREVVRVL